MRGEQAAVTAPRVPVLRGVAVPLGDPQHHPSVLYILLLCLQSLQPSEERRALPSLGSPDSEGSMSVIDSLRYTCFSNVDSVINTHYSAGHCYS